MSVRIDPVLAARNELASNWMHRGMDFAADNSIDGARREEAVRCFDEAIALRLTLPLEDPWYRYALSAGWVNRGDALAQGDDGAWVAESLTSYEEALRLLRTLSPDDNPLYARRLAITLIHQGLLLGRIPEAAAAGAPAACFREAVRTLDHPGAQALEDRDATQAGAWVNLAASLLGVRDLSVNEIFAAAQAAIALTDAAAGTDELAARTNLGARHVLGRLAVQRFAANEPLGRDLLAEVTDLIENGLSVARNWTGRPAAGPGTALHALSHDLFGFGCRIYAESQPHFVAEFVLETLAPPAGSAVLPLTPASLRIGNAAVWAALERLQRGGYGEESDPERASRLLAEVRKLRTAQERLAALEGEIVMPSLTA